MAKQALGKGLGALIRKQPDAADASGSLDATGENTVHRVKIDQVIPSPLQPRSAFSEEQLSELKESIRHHGIIQPLIVRLVDGKYELIAGERRWRASKSLGLAEVPLIIRTASDLEVLEMALIENLQRQDLSPIEEAQGYVRLASEFEMKQEEIANRVGKSRASVANAMRLLDLHPEIQTLVAQAKLSVGHAKAILTLKDQDAQLVASSAILKKGMTVRAAERMTKDFQKNGGIEKLAETTPSRETGESSDALRHIQSTLRDLLATQVTIQHTPKKGKIEIEYYGNDDLQRILELIGMPSDSV